MATVSNLHWVDYVVIVGYFALVIAVGIISSIKVFIIFISMLMLNFQRFSSPSYHIFVISITPNHFEAEKLYNKKCKSNLAKTEPIDIQCIWCLVQDSLSGVWCLSTFVMIFIHMILPSNSHLSHGPEQKRLSCRILPSIKEDALDPGNF